jgi:L-malate glycosyltransferase
MNLVLLGDGESPHLLKWAHALAPHVQLWAASSRGFLPEFDDVIPAGRRLALQTTPAFEGGNIALIKQLARLAGWLRQVRPDWIHAHYLTSHGTLAWLATSMLGVPGRIVGSAWGSDILVTPERSWAWRLLTRRVLRSCALTTSDSHVMAERMRSLGAREVMVFPFGLDALPQASAHKDPCLFFANRGLEPIYRPQRVLDVFARIAQSWPSAQLVVANSGSLRQNLQEQAAAIGITDRVRFIGRVSAGEQAEHYQHAQWYVSLPASDSVSVSVLEAMAHGCIPVVSDLPANRELVRDGANGIILSDGAWLEASQLDDLSARAPEIASANRAWIEAHALFPQSVTRFLARLRELDASLGVP